MDPVQLAEAVRAACVRAAATAYEEAGLLGLCAEGRWEAAVGAVRSLDVRGLVDGLEREGASPAEPGFAEPGFAEPEFGADAGPECSSGREG